MDDLNFCPTCGKDLPFGTSFCPACGMSLSNKEGDRKEKTAAVTASADRINIAVILLIVTAVVSILSGIIVYFQIDSLMDWMARVLSDAGYTSDSMEFMRGMLLMTAVLSIIGGAVAAVSAMLAHKRRMWTLTIITCIIATIIGNLIFGLIALYFLYKAKPAFTD
jgi:uncharacterized membrane protein